MTENTFLEKNKKINVGDIFVSIWGYEQTNVNFYQVISFNGKKTVVLREITKNFEETTYRSGNATPINDAFIVGKDTIKRRINYSSSRVSVKINDVQRAFLHQNGKTYYCSSYN